MPTPCDSSNIRAVSDWASYRPPPLPPSTRTRARASDSDPRRTRHVASRKWPIRSDIGAMCTPRGRYRASRAHTKRSELRCTNPGTTLPPTLGSPRSSPIWTFCTDSGRVRASALHMHRYRPLTPESGATAVWHFSPIWMISLTSFLSRGRHYRGVRWSASGLSGAIPCVLPCTSFGHIRHLTRHMHGNGPHRASTVACPNLAQLSPRLKKGGHDDLLFVVISCYLGPSWTPAPSDSTLFSTLA
jgi:hypothetical protein